MQNQQNSLGYFSKLKKYLLEHLIMFLSLHEILYLKNRVVYALLFGQNARLAKEHLIREIKLFLGPQAIVKSSMLKDLSIAILSGKPCIIPILGYMATGGFQDLDERYHYTNLFKLTDYFHCSNYGNHKNLHYYGAFVYNDACNRPFFISTQDLWVIKSKLIKKIAERFYVGHEVSQFVLAEQVKKMCSIHPLPPNDETEVIPVKIKMDSSYMLFTQAFNSTLPALDMYSSTPIDNKDRFNDIKLLESRKSLLEYPCCISNLYVDNKYEYTCPIKTFVLFIHMEIELNEMDKYFISLLDDVNTEEKMKKKAELAMLTIIERGKKLNVTNPPEVIIEFDPDSQKERNLKLVCWGELNNTGHRIINFKPFTHYGRYMIAKFISTQCTCQDTIDCSKFLLFGNFVK